MRLLFTLSSLLRIWKSVCSIFGGRARRLATSGISSKNWTKLMQRSPLTTVGNCRRIISRSHHPEFAQIRCRVFRREEFVLYATVPRAFFVCASLQKCSMLVFPSSRTSFKVLNRLHFVIKTAKNCSEAQLQYFSLVSNRAAQQRARSSERVNR